jgi:hypothetical protein
MLPSVLLPTFANSKDGAPPVEIVRAESRATASFKEVPLDVAKVKPPEKAPKTKEEHKP